MATLVERYWGKLDCEYALNDGGSSLVEDGKVKYVGVGTAEKLPRGAKLEATGSSGHGSVPRVDNAVIHLAEAVAKAGTWETPARLNETTREFFQRLASISPPEESAWYRDVLDPKVQEQLKVKKPQYYSMLRNTLREASGALSSADKSQAFIKLRVAFDKLHQLISKDVPLIDEPRSLHSDLPRDAMSDLYSLQETISECVETLNVSMLGIDPVRYTYFISNTPRVSWSVSGQPQVILKRDYNSVPDQVFNTCFEFVVDVALNADR